MLCRRTGDPFRLAKCLDSLGVAHLSLGDLELARRLIEESLEIARNDPDDGLPGNVLNHLSVVALEGGDLELSIPLIGESVELATRSGDHESIIVGRFNLAVISHRAGCPASEAHGLLCQIVDDVRALGDPDVAANVLEFALIAAELERDMRAARLSACFTPKQPSEHTASGVS